MKRLLGGEAYCLTGFGIICVNSWIKNSLRRFYDVEKNFKFLFHVLFRGDAHGSGRIENL
ncbi:MAG: hypothetical protein LBK06_08150 [Planctomycetaceae bacterium]|nr:hypothetical protein [Planctomycetaceae bacterium]